MKNKQYSIEIYEPVLSPLWRTLSTHGTLSAARAVYASITTPRGRVVRLVVRSTLEQKGKT